MKRSIASICLLIFCIVTSGCATVSGLAPFERRAIESRDLHCSYDNAYRAILSVLQDNNYTILNSNYESGLIRATTGEKPAPYLRPGEVEGRPEAIDILGLLAGEPTNKSTAVDATFTIEKYTDEITKMRIVIDKHIYNKKGKRIGSERESKPEILRQYYAVIQKEIFMREQLEKE